MGAGTGFAVGHTASGDRGEDRGGERGRSAGYGGTDTDRGGRGGRDGRGGPGGRPGAPGQPPAYGSRDGESPSEGTGSGDLTNS